MVWLTRTWNTLLTSQCWLLVSATILYVLACCFELSANSYSVLTNQLINGINIGKRVQAEGMNMFFFIFRGLNPGYSLPFHYVTSLFIQPSPVGVVELCVFCSLVCAQVNIAEANVQGWEIVLPHICHLLVQSFCCHLVLLYAVCVGRVGRGNREREGKVSLSQSYPVF